MTPALSELLPFALLGLLGSAHCAGMCGGFAIGVALGAGASRRRAFIHSLAFALGKALTYSILGLLAAHGAHALVHTAAALGSHQTSHMDVLETLRRGMAWGAGVVCLVLACTALGVIPRFWRVPALHGSRGQRVLSRIFAATSSLDGTARSFGIGMVTGWLPCGLSWAALALAAGSAPALAASGLFVFGLATAPVLVSTALTGHLLPADLRRRLRPVGAVLLCVFAILTFARGGAMPTWTPAADMLPACCQTGR
jgi:sulfite exporter TauE/SafE